MKKRTTNRFTLSLFIALIAGCAIGPMSYIRSTFDEVEQGQNRVSKNDVTIVNADRIKKAKADTKSS